MAVTFTPADTSFIGFGHNTTFNGTTWAFSLWFNRAGAGTAVSTGTGGTTMEPIFAKGAGQAESPLNLNANMMIGYSSVGLNIRMDFEDSVNGTNRPVTTFSTLNPTNDVWYHICGGYRLDTFSYYIWTNGANTETVTLGSGLSALQKTPEVTCIQHLGIGAFLNSTGGRSGWFNGRITELYHWTGYVLTAEDVAILYGGGAPLVGVGATISPTNLKCYPDLYAKANGVTLSGSNTIRNAAYNQHGTPTNSPQGYTDPFQNKSLVFASSLYDSSIY